MGKIERAVKNKLVRLEDVCSPMDYYVPFLRSTHGQVLIPYMEQLRHTDALKFMERFDTSVPCQKVELTDMPSCKADTEGPNDTLMRN